MNTPIEQTYDQIKIPVLSQQCCRRDTPAKRLAYAKRVRHCRYHVIEYPPGSSHEKRFGIVCLGRKYGEHEEYFDTYIHYSYATREEAVLIAQLVEYFSRHGDLQAEESLWDVDRVNARSVINRPRWPRNLDEEQWFTLDELNRMLKESHDWRDAWPQTLPNDALRYLSFSEKNHRVDWQETLFHMLATVAFKCEDGLYRSFGHSLQSFCGHFGLPWHFTLNERLIPKIVEAHSEMLSFYDYRPFRWVKDVEWLVDPSPYAHTMAPCSHCGQRPIFFSHCHGLTYGDVHDQRNRFMFCPFEAYPCPDEKLSTMCCRCREVWLEDIVPKHSIDAIEEHINHLLAHP